MIKVLEQFDIIAACLCLRQQMSSSASASGHVWLDEYSPPPPPPSLSRLLSHLLPDVSQCRD